MARTQLRPRFGGSGGVSQPRGLTDPEPGRGNTKMLRLCPNGDEQYCMNLTTFSAALKTNVSRARKYDE
jgi:hypothetical protein